MRKFYFKIMMLCVSVFAFAGLNAQTCASPTPLTSGVTIAGETTCTVGNVNVGVVSNAGVGNDNNYVTGEDVVYSYTTGAGSAEDLTVSIDNVTGTWGGYQMVSGTCDDAAAVGLGGFNDNSGAATDGSFVATGVPASTTIYIYASTWSTPVCNPSYDITLTAAPAAGPPANDDCANAIGLTVNPDLACGVVTAGTTQSATASTDADDVSGTPDDDVWFSFTATATSHEVSLLNITGATTDMGMGLYDNTHVCGDVAATSFATSDPETATFSGLTIGNVYTLRVYGWFAGSGATNFDVCVGTPPLPPANDDCANAIGLTVNPDLACGVVTAGTTQSATASTDADDVSGTPDDDVWFSFTATATSHEVSLLNITGATTDMGMGLYDNTHVCGDVAATSFATSDPETATFSGLTIGNVYTLRVYGWFAGSGATNFDVCVGTLPSPPIYDDCANAIPIAVNTDGTCTLFSSGDNLAATFSAAEGIPNTGASCTDGDAAPLDIWFSFVAPATGSVDVTTLLFPGFSSFVEIYSGVCGTLTAQEPGVCSNVSPQTFNGLTPGSTYYLRVWDFGSDQFGQHDICVTEVPAPPPAPANDDCVNAIGLTVNADLACGVVTSATTVSATASTDFDDVTGTPDDDVWFTFVATDVTHVVSLLNIVGATTDMGMALYDNTHVCGDVAAVSIDDSDPETAFFAGLTVGNTYTLRVYGWFSGSGGSTFDVCVGSLPPPPTNDECINAIPAPVNPTLVCVSTVSGSTISASASAYPDDVTGDPDDDVWYQFVATDNEHVVGLLNIVGATTDMGIGLYNGTCSLLQYVDDSDPETVTFTGLSIGDTYYLRIYTWGTATGGASFDLCIGTNSVPANDDLCNSENIIVNVGTGFGDNSLATPDGAVVGSCFTDGTVDNDVWFDFVAPAGGEVDVNYLQLTGDNQMVIFSAAGPNDCTGTLTEISCSDGAPVPAVTNLTGLTPGDSYFIQVDGWQATGGTFAIDISTPAPTTGFVWSGASDDDWNNTANWVNGVVPNGCADDVYIGSTGTPPTIDGIYTIGNLSNQVGAVVNCDALGALIVCGNATLSGGFVQNGPGAIALDATGGSGTTVDISGTATMALLGANTAYSINSGTLRITEGLGVNGVALTNGGANVVLASDAAGTAYFDDFTAGGSFVGDMTVERYITPGSGYGQRYIGAAVSGSAVTGLDGTYNYGTGQLVPTATCDPTVLEDGSPYSSIMEWQEDVVTTCNQEGFFALDPTTALMAGRGYSAWLVDGQAISVTGTPNTGTPSYGGLTNTAASVEAGWHLLANPFPSPINMSAVAGNGFTSPQYYDASSGAFSGTFQAIAPASEIPVMQGFVANTAGAGNWAPTSTDRVASTNANFFSTTGWFDHKLDVIVMGNGFGDKTSLYYSDNNTASFDTYGDCVKRNSNFGQPTLFTHNDGENMSLNGYATSTMGESVKMGLNPGAAGEFTFSFEGLNTFPANTTIYVEDMVTGVYHNIENGDYTFTSLSAEDVNRFVIHFVPAVELTVTPVACDGALGSIVAADNTNRTFELLNGSAVQANGNVSNMNEAVNAGTYTVLVADQFGGTQSYDVVVEALEGINADFSVSSLDVEVNEVVSLSNLSAGANDLTWSIDGNIINNVQDLTYTFNEAGSYNVVLTASNDVCRDSQTYTVNVSDKSTSITNLGDDQLVKIYATNNVVNLTFVNVKDDEATVEIFNMLGQDVANAVMTAEGTRTLTVNNVTDGYYIVKLTVSGTSSSTKVLLTNK